MVINKERNILFGTPLTFPYLGYTRDVLFRAAYIIGHACVHDMLTNCNSVSAEEMSRAHRGHNAFIGYFHW